MNFLKDVIDMHVHTNPDLRVRAYDDFELTNAGVRVSARGIVIKTHQGSTAERAYLCNRYNEQFNGINNFEMIGSITLNNQIGGLNPYAVETALKLGAKVVWLPTSSAKNHLEKMKKSTDSAVEVVKNRKIVKELKPILKLVKDFNVVFATAHLSPEEIFIVVEEAKNYGIEKIVVTHPEWWVVDMGLSDQKRIVKNYNVYLERCYASNIGGGKYISNLPSNLECIREVGAKNIIISTDGGQVENPNWEIALNNYLTYLYEHGISKEDIFTMSSLNQKKLLELKEV